MLNELAQSTHAYEAMEARRDAQAVKEAIDAIYQLEDTLEAIVNSVKGNLKFGFDLAYEAIDAIEDTLFQEHDITPDMIAQWAGNITKEIYRKRKEAHAAYLAKREEAAA